MAVRRIRLNTDHTEQIVPHHWYDAKFLAKHYGVHPVTIFKWQARGIIPAGKLIGPNSRRWQGRTIIEHEAALAE